LAVVEKNNTFQFPSRKYNWQRMRLGALSLGLWNGSQAGTVTDPSLFIAILDSWGWGSPRGIHAKKVLVGKITTNTPHGSVMQFTI